MSVQVFIRKYYLLNIVDLKNKRVTEFYHASCVVCRYKTVSVFIFTNVRGEIGIHIFLTTKQYSRNKHFMYNE